MRGAGEPAPSGGHALKGRAPPSDHFSELVSHPAILACERVPPLVPGKSELRSGSRGKDSFFLRPCLSLLRTESTPILYIASSDGLVEIQFHILNYQFSWGGEESSILPLLRWVLDPHCGLGSALHYFPPLAWWPFPLLKRGRFRGPVLSSPHAPPCPFAQLPRYPQQWGGVKQGGVAGPVPVSI